MKTLLYITFNPKDEIDNINKQLGEEFIYRFLIQNPEYNLETVNLSQIDIPIIEKKYTNQYLEIINLKGQEILGYKDQDNISKIEEISKQFLQANRYVIALSLFETKFSEQLKRYFDCILVGMKKNTIKSDKKMVYLQTIEYKRKWLSTIREESISHYKIIFKTLGIKQFKLINIDGIIEYKDKPSCYLMKAYRNISYGIEMLK
ncbi:MAG: NAD(P)H-dependent oxidoreductase [Cellulosilyticaceae bacterium]